MSGINESNSIYLQTKPVDKLQKSEASKILMDDYDFSTNVIEASYKGDNRELKLTTDLNLSTNLHYLQEQLAHSFHFNIEATSQHDTITNRLKYSSSTGTITGFTDFGKYQKQFMFSTYSTYMVKTDG